MTNDIDRGPTTQIRDFSYPISTPSILQGGNEPVPDEMVKDLLLKFWIPTQANPRPTIVVKNEKHQVSLRGQDEDTIAVSVANYGVEFEGHRHEFYNVDVPIHLELKTTVSRQRMWNMMGECRRLIFQWILALKPFQSLYFDGFSPNYDAVNHFTGTVQIRLTADALPIFLGRVTGEELPDTDPAFFEPPNDIPEGA